MLVCPKYAKEKNTLRETFKPKNPCFLWLTFNGMQILLISLASFYCKPPPQKTWADKFSVF